MAASSGKYYSDVKQGNVYIGSTLAAGTTYPLATGTAMTFGLWNTTSGKNAVLLGLNMGFTSGTIALGQIGLTIVAAGAALGTPISAFTDGVFGTTIRNALFGAQGGPAMRFTPSASTIAAASMGYWTGCSFPVAAVVSQMLINHDFDGKVILGPGQAAFVTGSIAQTALFSMSLLWAEVPA